MYLVAAISGAAVLAWHGVVAPTASSPQHHHGSHGIHHGSASWLPSYAWWIVMVTAMMLPVAAPSAHHVAANSLWSRRQRAMTSFVLTYLAVWMAFGVAATLGVSVLRLTSASWASVILLAAAVWHVSPPRLRLMRRCGVIHPVAVKGWPATLDCSKAGLLVGARCLLTCGPAMVAMVVGHSTVVMLGLATVLYSERKRGPNPGRRAARAPEAWGLVALAGVAAIVGS